MESDLMLFIDHIDRNKIEKKFIPSFWYTSQSKNRQKFTPKCWKLIEQNKKKNWRSWKRFGDTKANNRK